MATRVCCHFVTPVAKGQKLLPGWHCQHSLKHAKVYYHMLCGRFALLWRLCCVRLVADNPAPRELRRVYLPLATSLPPAAACAAASSAAHEPRLKLETSAERSMVLPLVSSTLLALRSLCTICSECRCSIAQATSCARARTRCTAGRRRGEVGSTRRCWLSAQRREPCAWIGRSYACLKQETCWQRVINWASKRSWLSRLGNVTQLAYSRLWAVQCAGGTAIIAPGERERTSGALPPATTMWFM